MAEERNWAEHDRQIRDNPSLEDAEKTGAAHAAYGWACSPWGHWSEEHKAAYRRGFEQMQLVNKELKYDG